MSDPSITVTVKLYAAFQEAYGTPELKLELPRKTPVSHLLARAISDHPHLESWRPLTRFGINLEFAEPETPLEDGDEVVLIPPVSGG
ncbi:MoaD/ThiS family protein [Lyngbya sp. CCY1209]|jgi:molybdopterin synthase sulfur carrier subunit|uniref:MoaD/ThiS family protein n=1 Tax=Lyngbya sp. CCY1209 TaxID=2886103 RepID=UPI002D2091A8|nr:MoaD/ThiS family protein [Lyngbya sp. CCY1209]MEB3883655.1 MoaD/ThiS family protein [Lyngbya sp. CCY1209]